MSKISVRPSRAYVRYYVWDLNLNTARWRDHIDVRDDTIINATGKYSHVKGWSWDAWLIYAKAKKLEWARVGQGYEVDEI